MRRAPIFGISTLVALLGLAAVASATITVISPEHYPRGCRAIRGEALQGDAEANTIWGTAKTDLLIGAGGSDVLHGEDNGDYRPDCLFGQGGPDHLFGGRGFDFLAGGTAADTLSGGPTDDVLVGEDGDDVLRTGRGFADYALGSRGDDVISGGMGLGDALLGNRGDDQVTSHWNQSLLEGGPGDDVLTARGDDLDGLFGGPGNDKLTARDNAELSGGKGDDLLRDVHGPVLIECGKGTDTIVTNMATRYLHGCERVIRRSAERAVPRTTNPSSTRGIHDAKSRAVTKPFLSASSARRMRF
jgi:Ca2+-binding RTX toxin-like protein